LDEIQSITYATSVTSLGALFTQATSDNNHLLNSVFLYWMGPDREGLWYRFPSLLFGTLSLFACVFYFKKNPRWFESFWILFWLFGTSFVMTTYSSEARGYSFVIFFSLVSFFELDKIVHNPGESKKIALKSLFLLEGALLLGALSHGISYIHFVGLALWASIQLRKRPLEVFRIFFLPGLFYLVFYFSFYSRLNFGGATARSCFEVLRQSVLWSLGIPGLGRIFAKPVLGAGILLAAGGMLHWVRTKNSKWIYFFTVSAVDILFMFFSSHSQYLSERYFIFLSLSLIFLISQGLYVLFQWNRLGKGVSLCFLVLMSFGNISSVSKLISIGRGEYLDAMKYLRDNTASDRISIGAINTHRLETVIRYYETSFSVGPLVKTFEVDSIGLKKSSDWFILEYEFHMALTGQVLTYQGIQGNVFPPDQSLVLPSGDHYQLKKVFPHYGLSGFTWIIYQKVNQAVRFRNFQMSD
jgi:hypothetical protein